MNPEPPSLATSIRTERTVLRPPRTSDVNVLVAAMRRNEAHLRPWTPQRPGADRRPTLATIARDIAAARRSWRRDEAYTFFVFDRGVASPTVIGRVTLGRVLRGAFQNSFLGYWIDVSEQGKGIMTEAVHATLGFAFGALGLHRVQAGVMPKNPASMRILEKLGFRREGVAERYLQIAGKWEDHVLFALTREEWADG